MPYQVMYEADFVEQRHRGTTFFRWLLAIPLFIWGALWSIAVEVVVVIAWFALLFTGRYPQGLYNFVASYLRFSGRALGYVNVMTDAYLAFGGADDPSYPVRVSVAPPLPKYGRWRVFLRLPIAVLGLAVSYFGFATVLAVASSMPLVRWIVIVNDGRARQSLQRVTWVYNAFSIRVTAWAFLVAQDLPPFLSEWQRSAMPPPEAGTLAA
ncbi:MAG: DUF4389 domain-containing protein [Actinobacteria bacterium]|nr:MAG: DUF4389 domain-containing protein [Actinomycetota bacterium]